MKNKLIKVLFIVLIIISISTGCTSRDAKIVIEDIDALREITLDSSSMLQEINDKYNLLSEKDKEDVTNYPILEAANEKYSILKCKDFDARIYEACSDVTSESLPILNKLLDEYEKLGEEDKARIGNLQRLENAIKASQKLKEYKDYEDFDARIYEACSDVTSASLPILNELLDEYEKIDEEGKAHIENLQMLKDAIEESQKLKANEITVDIAIRAKSYMSSAKSLLSEYADIMNDEQIELCLKEIGRWDAVYKAEDCVKDYLKNPASYTRYSGACSNPELQDDGTYRLEVTLVYGATNSFNAMIKDEVDVYVYFTIDVASRTVNYTEAKLTPYYKYIYTTSYR